MGKPQSAQNPPPPIEPQPPNPYQPRLTKEVNVAQYLYTITTNDASIHSSGVISLKTLNMPKKGRMQRASASWTEATTGGGPARIDYGELWVDVFLARGNRQCIRFFSDYLTNAADLSWDGDFDFDENDGLVLYTANTNAVSTFDVSVTLTYTQEVLQ